MRILLVFIASVFLLSSCRKEKTSWDTDWSAPLLHGHLTLTDLIPPEYLATNSEGYLSIVFHQNAYQFTIDTLVNLPDTSVSSFIQLGPSTISVNPAFTWSGVYDSDYDLNGIELKRVIAKQGTATIDISSPWQGKTVITLTFPLINEFGTAFSRTYYLDSGSVANPVLASDAVDMTGFDLDLRGLLGLSYNEIPANYSVASNEASATFDVNPSDTVHFNVSFQDLLPDYALGYFGSYTLSDTIGISLAPMKKILGGTLDIDSIDLTLTVKNGFNLIAQSKITKLTGINTRTGSTVELGFPDFNSWININPAIGGLYDMVPSEYPLPVNTGNSNIDEFAENFSDSMSLGYILKINPDGNVSAGNDELFPTSSLDLFVDAEIPLHFGANDLTLADTFDISYTASTTVIPDNGEIVMHYDNGFPLSAGAVFYLLDEDGVLLDSISSTGIISSGSYDDVTFLTDNVTGIITYAVPASTVVLLEDTKKIVVRINFTSDGGAKVKIDSNAWFDFKIHTNIQIRLEV